MWEASQLADAFAGRLKVKMAMKLGLAGQEELSGAGVARNGVGPELYHKTMAAYKEAVEALIGT